MNLKSIPFARILLPYIGGILLALYFGFYPSQHLVFAITCFLFLITFIGTRKAKGTLLPAWRITYLMLLHIVLITLAFETLHLYKDSTRGDHYTQMINTTEKSFMIATVNDLPVRTDKFYKLPVEMQAVYTHGKWQEISGKSIVYAGKEWSRCIHAGDRILVHASFTAVSPPANPYEFDYATYLEEHNVYSVIYLKAGELTLLESGANSRIGDFGTVLKQGSVHTLRESGLSADAYSICAALLVGYDDEISRDVMNSFSHSGTLHVLSVSGLHTGVLYACILWLFGLFDRHNRYPRLKCVVVIAAMITLVCITGFAPAVSRAALMVSLVLIGKTFFRHGNAFNTLFLSAFILLLYDPYLVKDIGFLLSYLAVFGIMYLYPRLQTWYMPAWKPLRWLWDSTLLSVSATVFTLPVSLFYFHQFPTWFIFSNLVIIPLSIGLMVMAVALLCLHSVVFLKTGLVWAINKLTALMIGCSSLSDNEHWGYVDLICFGKAALFFSSVLLILFLIVMEKKQYRHLMYTGFVIMAWLLWSMWAIWQDQCDNLLIVYKSRNGQALLLRQHGTVYGISNTSDRDALSMQIRPYLQHTYFNRLYVLSSKNWVQLPGHTIGLIDTRVPSGILEDLRVSTIVAGKNTLHSLDHPGTLSRLILSGRYSDRYVVKLKQQCAVYGISLHRLTEQGAYIYAWKDGD